MSSPLDEFIKDNSSGLFIPPQARRQVVPYDDLQALATPERLPQISPDLISALAILVAQGGTRAKLITATDSGELYVAATSNFSTKVADVAPGGSFAISVDDPTWAAQASWFWAIKTPAHGGTEQGPYFAFPSADPHIVTITVPLASQLDVGDILFSVPNVMILGGASNVGLAIDDTSAFPGGTSVRGAPLTDSVDAVGRRQLRTDATRAPEGYAIGGPVANAAVTANFVAPGVGRRWQLMYLSASSFSTVAGANDTLEVWKNGAGTGTLLFSEVLTPQLANTADRFNGPCPPIMGDDNGTINIRMTAVAATLLHSVHAGAWFLA